MEACFYTAQGSVMCVKPKKFDSNQSCGAPVIEVKLKPIEEDKPVVPIDAPKVEVPKVEVKQEQPKEEVKEGFRFGYRHGYGPRYGRGYPYYYRRGYPIVYDSYPVAVPYYVDGVPRCGATFGTRCPAGNCCTVDGYCGSSLVHCGYNNLPKWSQYHGIGAPLV